MSQHAISFGSTDRAQFVQRGQKLEYFTLVYNSLEGLIAIAAGLLAGSIALTGFGFDSAIEVTSGAVLLWRLRADLDEARRRSAERISLRVVGACFLALAAYVVFESVSQLVGSRAPDHSVAGMILAAVSLVVMPLLSRAKRRVARRIQSAAMTADAKQAEFCAYLSAILLGGLSLNALLGWWWADPAAALAMAPIIAREGVGAVREKSCCDATCH